MERTRFSAAVRREVGFAAVVEVREVAEDGLAAWVELRGLCNPEPTSVEAYLDWKRQAEDAQ